MPAMELPLMEWWRVITDWAGGDGHASLLIAALIITLSLVLRGIFIRLVLGRITAWVRRSSSRFDDVLLLPLAQPLGWMFVLAGMTLALEILPQSHERHPLLHRITSSALILMICWIPYRIIGPLSDYLIHTRLKDWGEDIAHELIDFCTAGIKILIIVVAVIVLLQHWGFNITTLIGGLGIIGAAIALAAKDNLQNILSGFTIITSRIFRPGDWIKTADVEGIVTTIGLRATRLRTFQDAEMTIGNTALLESSLTNWSRMRRRRVRMQIGLEYSTDARTMGAIIDRLRLYLEKSPDLAKDSPPMVHFTDYGDSAIIIDLYYFTQDVRWAKWRDTVHRHIIDFKKIVEEEGGAFAFPSLTVYRADQDPPKAGKRDEGRHAVS